MKINGSDALVNRITVTLPRVTGDLAVTVRAIPLGWVRQFDALVPVVRPPLKATGAMTNAGPKMVPDTDDADFRTDFADRLDLSSFFMLHLVLRDAPEIDLTLKTLGSADDIRKFRAEVAEAGLSDGDVQRLMDATRELSNLSSDEVAMRRAGF